ncbi:MAG: hypothetical protein J5857_06615, partial [Treponema sp.]|nr:hypothetical protein [Treponema sp.]
LLISVPGLYAAGKNDDISHYPSYFNQVISSAKSKASSGQFTQAAKIFIQEKSGVRPLEFQYDTFLKEGHSDSVVSQVQNIKSDIQESINEYLSYQDKLDSYKKNINSTLNSKNPDLILTEYKKIEPVLKSLVKTRNKVYSSGLQSQSLFNEARKKGIIQDASYLSYLSKFILGNGKDEYTGMIGVMDLQLLQTVEAHIKPLYSLEQDFVKKLSAQFQEISPPSYPVLPEAIKSRCLQIEQIFTVMNSLIETDDARTGENKAFIQDNEYLTSIKALFYIYDRTLKLVDLTEKSVNLVYEIEDFIDKSVADIAQDLRDKKDDISVTFVNQSNTLLKYGNSALDLEKEKWIDEVKKISSNSQKWNDFISVYVNSCSSLNKYCSAKSLNALKMAGERLVDAAKNMYAEDTEKFQVLQNLIPNDSNPNAQQYPTKLIAGTKTFRQSISLDVNTLKSASEILNAGNASFKSTIQSLQKRINDSINSIDKLNNETTLLAEKARAQQREALQAQNQIDLYYNRAISAYNAGNYKTARQNLDRANTLYDASISSLSRDAGIKEEVYSKLTKLKQNIAEKQKPLLVQEIRVYKTNAKNAYYAGNFDEASIQLAEAEKTRENWGKFMDVELDEDEELNRLNNLVNTALAIKSGKELNPNDALYPEMSQILSISNQYYTQAQSLLDEGNKEEATVYLNKAKDKLNELKIIYPRNQQANLLSMRIDQILDIKQFNEAFKTRFEELKLVNYSLRDTSAQIAYSDLQDLYELEPDYPGLKSFMSQTEINLGLRQKPIDNSSIEEAQALAEQAYTQLSEAERDTIKLESARNLANRALVLNPNNDLAISVLDEVALRTGTTAAVILSRRDEEKYQQAITYLQNGNVVAANSNLQELLQTPANRRSAKVQKLQSRIQGMLN